MLVKGAPVMQCVKWCSDHLFRMEIRAKYFYQQIAFTMGKLLVKFVRGPFDVMGLLYNNHNALPDQPCQPVSIYWIKYIIVIYKMWQTNYNMLQTMPARVHTWKRVNHMIAYKLITEHEPLGFDSTKRCLFTNTGIHIAEKRRYTFVTNLKCLYHKT